MKHRDLKKFYKYGFYFLLLLLITGLNYYFHNNVQQKQSDDLEVIQRYNSLLYSRNVQGKFISNYNGLNYKKNKNIMIDFSKPTLLILLSKFGCSHCQNREIGYMKKFSDNNINKIGVFINSDIDIIKKLDRALDIDFELTSCDKKIFSNLSLAKTYPQVFYINDNRIVSSLFPLVQDDQFSINFYKNIKKFDVK